MIRAVQRLKTAFVVDVTSRDIALLFEAPDAMFDEARMASEFGLDGGSKRGRQDRIAGTAETGAGKSISGGAGKSRRT